MPKLYAYSYKKSALAARRPMTRVQMLEMLNTSIAGVGCYNVGDFQVYELVPVSCITQTVVGFEEESE